MTQVASQPRMASGKIVTAWIIQGVLAVAFLAAAAAKLAGMPMMVALFDTIGLGQWFRIATALVEILGAVALLTPNYAAFGAAWLGATMFFASLTHLCILHSNPAAAILLLALNAVVLWLRRDQLAELRARLA